MFQYTAARRRLDCCCRWYGFGGYCFNTQPPEGGWPKPNSCLAFVQRFQHTAARRRLVPNRPFPAKRRAVSTHSRPKAAGLYLDLDNMSIFEFQHTAARRRLGFGIGVIQQPARFQHTAARRRLAESSVSIAPIHAVSTHSRPKAAGITVDPAWEGDDVSTHSRPKAAG